MSLRRFVIRTKKSFGLLHAGDDVPEQKETSEASRTDDKRDGSTKKDVQGHRAGSESPLKKSRFYGPWRRFRSEEPNLPLKSSITPASKNASPAKMEKDTDFPVEPKLTHEMDLNLLSHGALMPHTTPNNSYPSLIEVLHSSPIAVPTCTSHDHLPPSDQVMNEAHDDSFAVGTVPCSPAPLCHASVQWTIGNRIKPEYIPLPPSPQKLPLEDNMTPMPGTNLPLEGLDGSLDVDEDYFHQRAKENSATSKGSTVSSSGVRTSSNTLENPLDVGFPARRTDTSGLYDGSGYGFGYEAAPKPRDKAGQKKHRGTVGQNQGDPRVPYPT